MEKEPERISKLLAIVERQIQESKASGNNAALDILRKKEARLKDELKGTKMSTNMLAKNLLLQRKNIKSLSKIDFNDLIRRLSKRPEYAFLKSMAKTTIKNDIERPAKPVGWRFKGRGNYDKPTARQIVAGKKSGAVYNEKRPLRSDVSQVVKLKEGGSVNKIYYHIFQYKEFGKVDYKGYYNTSEEAKKAVAKFNKLYPDNYFHIFDTNSKDEPRLMDDQAIMAKGGKIKKTAIKTVLEVLYDTDNWGPDMQNQAYKKGNNLIYLDSFYYGEEKALKNLISEWSKDGHFYDYFMKEYSIEPTIISSFSEIKATGKHKKFTDNGIVGVELSFKNIEKMEYGGTAEDNDVFYAYWNNYNDGYGPGSGKNYDLDDVIEDAVEDWNNENELGSENEVSEQDKKDLKIFAKRFFDIEDWISYNIVKAMIASQDYTMVKYSQNRNPDNDFYEYWAIYNDQPGPDWQSAKSKSFDETIEKAVTAWNKEDEEEGYDNKVTPAQKEKLKTFAKKFYDVDSWISYNIVQAMIAQEAYGQDNTGKPFSFDEELKSSKDALTYPKANELVKPKQPTPTKSKSFDQTIEKAVTVRNKKDEKVSSKKIVTVSDFFDAVASSSELEEYKKFMKETGISDSPYINVAFHNNDQIYTNYPLIPFKYFNVKGYLSPIYWGSTNSPSNIATRLLGRDQILNGYVIFGENMGSKSMGSYGTGEAFIRPYNGKSNEKDPDSNWQYVVSLSTAAKYLNEKYWTKVESSLGFYEYLTLDPKAVSVLKKESKMVLGNFYDNFINKINVDPQFLEWKKVSYFRIDQKLIDNELYIAKQSINSLYDSLKSGNDVDPNVLDAIIENLNFIKSNIKQLFSHGGNVGSNISFIDWKGDIRTGVITEKLKKGYEVMTSDGLALVEESEILKDGGYINKSSVIGNYKEEPTQGPYRELEGDNLDKMFSAIKFLQSEYGQEELEKELKTKSSVDFKDYKPFGHPKGRNLFSVPVDFSPKFQSNKFTHDIIDAANKVLVDNGYSKKIKFLK